jgi:hypothetical protein
LIVTKIISVNTDGVRTLKVVCFGKNDVRTPAECAPFGDDSNPIDGMKAIYAETTTNGQDVIIGYINTQQLAQQGERRMYATDVNGLEQVRIWLHGDGTVELGGTGAAGSNINHATQWEALNAQLQDYLTNPATGLLFQINAGIVSAGGAFTPPAPLNITTAKLTKIKTE